MPTSPSHPLPPATLVIPTRGRPALLHDTVRSVLDGDEVPAELIVVDQSDQPDPAFADCPTVRSCHVRYEWTPVTGVSHARNLGIAAASHDALAFIDDDVVVTRRWFGALVRALVREGERTVVTGRVLPGPSREPGGFVPSTKTDEAPATYAGRVGRDVLFSGNMALYRSAFAEVGPFDVRLGGGTAFPSAEDNDLGYRLLEAGYRIHYEPDAAVHHMAWRRADERLALQWSYGHGQGAFYAKHASLRDRHMLARLWRDVRHSAQSFLYLARRRTIGTEQVVTAAALITGALRWVVRDRRRDPDRRRDG